MKLQNHLIMFLFFTLSTFAVQAGQCTKDLQAGLQLANDTASSDLSANERIAKLRNFEGNPNCLPAKWYFQLGLSYQETGDYRKSRMVFKTAKQISKNSNDLAQAAFVSANYAKSGWLEEKTNGRPKALAVWRNEADEANLLFGKSQTTKPEWFQTLLLEMDNWMKDANAEVMLSQLESQNPEFSRSYGVDQGLSLMILFEKGKDQLKPNGKLQLDRLSKALLEKTRNGGEVKIVGHASSEGGVTQNLDLSEKRARQVELYLLSKVSTLKGKTASSGHGASELRYDPDNTEAFRAGNRRVEIFIQ